MAEKRRKPKPAVPVAYPPPPGSVLERIESERMRLGISARALSVAAGLTPGHYTGIFLRGHETKEWNPGTSTTDRLIKALVSQGSSEIWLRAGTEDIEGPPAPRETRVSFSENEQRQIVAEGLKAAGILPDIAYETALTMQWHLGTSARERFDSALALARQIQAERKGKSLGVREYEDDGPPPGPPARSSGVARKAKAGIKKRLQRHEGLAQPKVGKAGKNG